MKLTLKKKEEVKSGNNMGANKIQRRGELGSRKMRRNKLT